MDIQVNGQSVIVFDLDDTLYNEIDYLRSAYIEIAKQSEPENWKILFARLFSLYRNGQNVFDYVSETYGTQKADLLHLYRNHTPTLKAFEGVHEIFRQIKEHEGRLCIITDGRSSTQRKKLEALGLLRYVDKLLISEETGFEKPDEHNYRLIETSFENKNYWYIADNIRKDFVAPNRLGWQTLCLIDNGLNIHHDGHLHINEMKAPKRLILSFKEINIT